MKKIVAFGDVDQASKQQLERCLAVSGEESRGVLCADHHKGYSMPIALYSTVHGAGRVMSRTQAAGKINRKTRKLVSPGLVNWPSWQARLKTQGVELRGGGPDEAPECYKRLTDVLAAHGDTIRVLHRLRPIGVAMAGNDVFDPYKD